MSFNKNYLNYNFIKYKYEDDTYNEDEYICIICEIRVEYSNWAFENMKTYSQCDNFRFLTRGEILSCEEHQIKKILE